MILRKKKSQVASQYINAKNGEVLESSEFTTVEVISGKFQLERNSYEVEDFQIFSSRHGITSSILIIRSLKDFFCRCRCNLIQCSVFDILSPPGNRVQSFDRIFENNPSTFEPYWIPDLKCLTIIFYDFRSQV